MNGGWIGSTWQEEARQGKSGIQPLGIFDYRSYSVRRENVSIQTQLVDSVWSILYPKGKKRNE